MLGVNQCLHSKSVANKFRFNSLGCPLTQALVDKQIFHKQKKLLIFFGLTLRGFFLLHYRVLEDLSPYQGE